MKRCTRCGKIFDERSGNEAGPLDVLAETFARTVGEPDDGLCPECREELGTTMLLGVGE